MSPVGRADHSLEILAQGASRLLSLPKLRRECHSNVSHPRAIAWAGVRREAPTAGGEYILVASLLSPRRKARPSSGCRACSARRTSTDASSVRVRATRQAAHAQELRRLLPEVIPGASPRWVRLEGRLDIQDLRLTLLRAAEAEFATITTTREIKQYCIHQG